VSKPACDTADKKISIELLKGLNGFWLPASVESGAVNMTVDKALLENVCHHIEPVVVVRAYAWAQPTLSLGINQPQRDVDTLDPDEKMPIVRRPTGGRAIWHGEDYSYAFLSNSKSLLNLSVHDSYCVIRQLLENSLQRLGISTEPETSLKQTKEGTTRAYARSAECFATRMPDDLILKTPESEMNTQKIAGSAQCRKAGGLLQHGSLYLKSQGVSFEAFTEALRLSAEECLGKPLQIWPMPEVFSALVVVPAGL
jgi:lipoate-protein ligase A